ncbi:hypothetical protein BaRGS_00010449 [Batillaria attramentaria]|uniref:Uncharacterized protein n=1 Tax=Batillaria attramentaria TaxID=370345 RepID=A0ABD0LGV6_9CAEN
MTSEGRAKGARQPYSNENVMDKGHKTGPVQALTTQIRLMSLVFQQAAQPERQFQSNVALRSRQQNRSTRDRLGKEKSLLCWQYRSTSSVGFRQAER